MNYFTIEEFNTSNSVIPEIIKDKILNNFISPLHNVRVFYNKPIYIRSGWRPVEYNKSINGASNSEHLYKKTGAADVSPTPTGIIPNKKDMDELESLLINSGKFSRIARYKTFFHIDHKEPKHGCNNAYYEAKSGKWIFKRCF